MDIKESMQKIVKKANIKDTLIASAIAVSTLISSGSASAHPLYGEDGMPIFHYHHIVKTGKKGYDERNKKKVDMKRVEETFEQTEEKEKAKELEEKITIINLQPKFEWRRVQKGETWGEIGEEYNTNWQQLLKFNEAIHTVGVTTKKNEDHIIEENTVLGILYCDEEKGKKTFIGKYTTLEGTLKVYNHMKNDITTVKKDETKERAPVGGKSKSQGTIDEKVKTAEPSIKTDGDKAQTPQTRKKFGGKETELPNVPENKKQGDYKTTVAPETTEKPKSGIYQSPSRFTVGIGGSAYGNGLTSADLTAGYSSENSKNTFLIYAKKFSGGATETQSQSKNEDTTLLPDGLTYKHRADTINKNEKEKYVDGFGIGLEREMLKFNESGTANLSLEARVGLVGIEITTNTSQSAIIEYTRNDSTLQNPVSISNDEPKSETKYVGNGSLAANLKFGGKSSAVKLTAGIDYMADEKTDKKTKGYGGISFQQYF